MNAVHRNVVWGLRGGLVGIPTDCPQRDERLGWTADAAAMAPSALFLGERRGVREVAHGPGRCPAPVGRVSRTSRRGSGSRAAAMPAGRTPASVVPWLIYQRTGNAGWSSGNTTRCSGTCGSSRRTMCGHPPRRPLRRLVRARGPDQPGIDRHGLPGPFRTIFVRMARILGRDRDADDIARLAVRARGAFRRRFTTAPGVLGRRDPDRLRPRARIRSPAAAREAGGRGPPGEAHRGRRRPPADRVPGYGACPPALSDNGHHELATRLARQDTFPSWGYEVRQGATTIWERWNSWTPEHGFADPGMNSLNHAALGSVADWLHEHLAGLAPGAPGYRTMLVRPRPAAGSSGRAPRTNRATAVTRSSGRRTEGASKSRSTCPRTPSPRWSSLAAGGRCR